MGAEELSNSHIAHVGAPKPLISNIKLQKCGALDLLCQDFHNCSPKPWLFAVDAWIGQAKLLAALHPLQIDNHQKAIWENKKEGNNTKLRQ